MTSLFSLALITITCSSLNTGHTKTVVVFLCLLIYFLSSLFENALPEGKNFICLAQQCIPGARIGPLIGGASGICCLADWLVDWAA